jgi:CBS domain-containing protein
MTGGAFGSMIAQMFRLSSAERKTLLAAGAAGGMSATFASPVAGVLLAVEILLFEWKPRSLVPVALASATATALRWSLLGTGPLFPVTPHPLTLGPASILGCVVAGVLAGALSILVTVAVYAAEDAFHLLPIHWMWWPPIGGLAVGLGGLFFPQALGVGYDVIASLLKGDIARNTILGILVVKATIWAVSLSSGTSGGVLAPLLMMGGALGGIETAFLPNNGPGFWQLVGMGATLGATMRTPLTAVVFAIELTRDVSMMFPLLVAVTIAHAVTVLALRRSILTEKVARRGYHLSCEYAVDPLEVFFVREIMRTNTVALPASMPVRELAGAVNLDHPERGQFLYPVVDEQRRLSGTLTRNDIERLLAEGGADGAATLADVARKAPLTASPDEPVRLVVNRMVETGRTRMPVVERDEPHRLLGMIAFDDVLKARTRSLAEERYRERVLRIHFWGSGRGTGRPPSRVA